MLNITHIRHLCTIAIAACLALPAGATAQTVTFNTVDPDGAGWTVPANVTSARFEVVGASGGWSGSSCTPGLGGDVTATTALTPGSFVTIFIGGKGGDASGNRGGDAGTGAGPGGNVLAGPSSEGGGGGGGQTYAVQAFGLTLVAGGGGGCGGFADANGGNGGDAGSAGANGSGGADGAAGGGSAGGDGGSGGADVPADSNGGTPGDQRHGGWGYGSDQFEAGGGGGGSGIGGGGGGGAAAGNDGSGGGGAGGGSIAAGVDGSSHVGSAPGLGDGWVTITYTPQPTPAVSVGDTTSTGDTSESIAGTVNGEDLGTTYYVEYGTTAGYGQRTGDVRLNASTADQRVSASLTGLVPGTTYHYRLVATNASGTTRGADHTVTTTGAPAASTAAASGVGGTTATLAGIVNPVGHATSYHFELGTTTHYGLQTSDSSAGAGFSEVLVSATVTGIAPGTVYHYRLVATNASGTTDGADEILKTGMPRPNVGTATPQIPAPAPRAQQPVLTVVGRPIAVQGSVRVTLACRFAPCRASVAVTASVGRHAGQTIGSSTARMRAGAHTTIKISLNAVGRRLLATHRRSTARVVLSLLTGSGGSQVVGSVPVASSGSK